MEIKSKEFENGVVLLSIDGELSTDTYIVLDREIKRNFELGKFRIVLDLSQATLMASLGVGVIFECLKISREQEGNVILLSPSEAVMKTLELLEVVKVFPMCNDFKCAMSIFNKTPLPVLRGHMRLFIRNPHCNTAITLTDSHGLKHMMLMADSSERGMGCVYVWKQALEKNAMLIGWEREPLKKY